MLDEYLNPDFIQGLAQKAIPYLGQLLLALLFLWIGWLVINWVTRLIDTHLVNHFDKNLAPFLKRIISLSLRVLLIISVLSTLGVETASFAALIGAFGVGLGLALSGMTQNFASAIIIFVTKPFEVGDQVQVGDVTGEVKKIRIFNTLILKRDRTYAWVPNSEMTSNTLINYYQYPNTRFEAEIGVSYDADHAEAEKIIAETIQKLDFVLPDPAVRTGVTELADNYVTITALFYTKSADFLRARLDVYGPVKKALDRAGIEIPYPQVDIHQK